MWCPLISGPRSLHTLGRNLHPNKLYWPFKSFPICSEDHQQIHHWGRTKIRSTTPRVLQYSNYTAHLPIASTFPNLHTQLSSPSQCPYPSEITIPISSPPWNHFPSLHSLPSPPFVSPLETAPGTPTCRCMDRQPDMEIMSLGERWRMLANSARSTPRALSSHHAQLQH